MSQSMPRGFLPSAMAEKLAEISRRQAVISVLRAIAIGASVLFAAMVVAMLIDWQLAVFSTGLRTTLTVTSLLLSVAAALIAGIPSLAASLKQSQAAINADAEIPQLEERWQTVVAVTHSERQPASSTAKAMLQQVTSEAVAIGRIVLPRHVVDLESLKTAVKLLAVCTVVLVGFLAINWPQSSILVRRFFAPTANISATSLSCPTGNVIVARGEYVELVTEMKGLRRNSAILTIAQSDSRPEFVELAIDKKRVDNFVHRMQVERSFQYRVRAGDGQTGWHTVTVVDYPSLAEVRFTIIAPAYLNRPNVEKTIIPSRLKVMQGSLLQLQMRPKEPLQSLELTVAPDAIPDEHPTPKPQIYSLAAEKDGWYRFNTQLTESLSISPQLWDSHGFTNENRTVCRIQVVGDNAPSARVLTPTEEMTFAIDDVVDIKFEAHDDHGITKAELVVYDESAANEGNPAPLLKVLPIALGDQEFAKHIVGTTQLDLKQLNLKPGTQVSYAVRVTDNRRVVDEPTTTSPRQSEQTDPESANGDSNRKLPSAASVAEVTSQTATEGQSDDSGKLPPSEDANQAGDDPAKAVAQHVDYAKAAVTRAAGQVSGSDSTKQASDDPVTPSTNSSDKSATDATKVSRTNLEKDLQQGRATKVGTTRGSDRELNNTVDDASRTIKKNASEITHNESERVADVASAQTAKNLVNPLRQISSMDSATTRKDVSRTGDDRSESETKSIEGNVPQSTDPASRPTGTARAAQSSAPNSQPRVTTTTESNHESLKSDSDAPPKSTRPSDSTNGRTPHFQNKNSTRSEHARTITMAPQQSESGQNAETNRRFLKITQRLSSPAEAREYRMAETSNVRDQVVEIDEVLAEAETGLTRIVNREILNDDQSAVYRNLDTQLGKAESKISVLRKETRDQQFAFIGLQMLDIGRSHVTPARERIFLAIREPVSASSGNSRGALQQIVRARELLAALLKRYDRVERDQRLAEALKHGIMMYEVYVEKMQQLMRESRQNQNPLDRKMAVLEVGQDYLDRYADVLTTRRAMMTEFGRILGDDPRLLARYLDLIKRRRSSLRDQLSELARQQKEAYGELIGWQAADVAQRGDLWNVVVELRMQTSTQLAKDASELGERIEKQFPLVLDSSHQTSAKVISLGREIAEASREISLEARHQIRQPDAAMDLRPKSRRLTQLFVDLDAMLERLGFEYSKETEVTTYVTGRILESRTVADQAELWRQTADHVHGKRYYRLAEIDQRRIAISTELLRVELLGIETELSAQFQQVTEKAIPDPIVAQIRQLQRLMEDITFEQTGTEFAMSENRLSDAAKLQQRASDNFAQAEQLFDRMRQAIADALDESKVRNPTVADLEDPKLDEFLTRLEREPNIDAQLGIPERPRNIRIIADSLVWQEEGASQLGAMEETTRARMKEEQRDRKDDNDLADAENRATEQKENELTDEERQQQEQLQTAAAELANAIEANRERANDPGAAPKELKQLEQVAKKLQEQVDQMQQVIDPGKLWKAMNADLQKTLALLSETAKDSSSATADSQRVEKLTKDMRRLLDQMRKESGGDNRWKMVADFERKNQILKAVARGERIPDEQWNKLLSKLDDGLWQVGGRSLPEEYRRAIEQYQEQIRKLTNGSGEDDR